MKKSYLGALALMSALGVNAQNGLHGGTEGMRQINAHSQGQGEYLFGIGMEAASGYNLIDGYSTRGTNGSTSYTDVNSKRPVAASVYANMGVGLTSFWDIYASLPFYYDHLDINKGVTPTMDEAWAAGLGDLELSTKLRLPLARTNPFQVAALLMMSTPTGSEDAGFYPRHLANVANGGRNTDPFTSQGFMAGAGMAMSLDLVSKGIPLSFNGHASFQHPWEYRHPNVFSWGLGMNQKSWEYATSFIEVSGEHRTSVLEDEWNPLCDRMTASAGMRFHLPHYWDLGMSVDFSPMDREQVVVTQRDDMGASKYTAGNRDFGVSALLVYNTGRRGLDRDKDGVSDQVDRCLGTPENVQVDVHGCPLDQDSDGVGDYKDKCPGTLAGIPVTSEGCPKDKDQDGIADYLDQCPNTASGTPVDARGCAQDLDQDGIADPLDKCPNTPKGVSVTTEGCPQDQDKDGIPDALDKCPSTSLDVPVDTTGCPRDTDKDGVADFQDKCPGTAAGLPVNAEGCPSDIDGDGVKNEEDQCPNTPQGLPVNTMGCPADTDGDGVADFQDKCPGTPQGVAVNTQGCPVDSDNDGVADYLDKCPRTLKGVEIKADGCPVKKEQDLTQLQRAINFETGSAKLTKDSYKTLDLVVALLKAIPDAKLEVQGHTDNTGSADKNTELSQQRAMSVVDYFTKQGVTENRLRPKGFGPSLPVQSNDTKAGRTANRRVELVPFD